MMDRRDTDHLNHLTVKLLEYNKKALQYFEKHQETKEAADFIEEVKPFADSVHKTADEWIELAAPFVKEKQPKYLHVKQIEDVHENIGIEAVTCFQPDTKRKRFIERNKSILYTLETLSRNLSPL
ncbi:YppE family protein [Evansella sp. LMS18]|uniref:YppE family protein n=1 Tax=Evansella sp. LMS18 TaxID=2924033 RepID=UPI0020D10EE1|nr:YppE family protein [Evansella sp. LMS18]UTR09670.1 YppE family protein [Evansella sp. LMS18]